MHLPLLLRVIHAHVRCSPSSAVRGSSQPKTGDSASSLTIFVRQAAGPCWLYSPPLRSRESSRTFLKDGVILPRVFLSKDTSLSSLPASELFIVGRRSGVQALKMRRQQLLTLAQWASLACFASAVDVVYVTDLEVYTLLVCA